MSLADDITREQNERSAWRKVQSSKCGDYQDIDCPNCGRHRVMLGDDGKRRCEKCCWCIEDKEYDGDLIEFTH